MTKKMKGNLRLDAALAELAQDFRGGVISHEMGDKITRRVLGDNATAKPAPLSPEEIRALRENAHMSQSVFASLLNITTGYLFAEAAARSGKSLNGFIKDALENAI